ncbi:ABC transporter permease [Sodalis ligni]|uniref:Peptide/nickel transport system permease protein n=1 Tax=Sodalis ligni TaxID=2697027 RepID=A0A4V2Q2L9_9GAMM|nr:ABC transporter permease [Sodalis ligni]TCL03378.1 peptide/nickel transport system permease protein [Sodalis ligni]
MRRLLFILHRPAALFGLLLMVLQIVLILFAPLLMPFDPMQADPLASLQAPSAVHWFGTDINGMDVLSRVIYATRINLLISVVSVFIAFVVGVPLGLLIGYYRNPFSHFAMRVFDFIQSFPIFVLGMALVSVTGQEIWNVAIVLAVLFIPVFARLIRAEVLSLRDRPFVAAARCSGAGDRHIMFSHLLPNAMLPAMIQVSISIGMAILLTAGLSFVGAGVRMPTPEWGLMVAGGAQQMILGVWWVSLFPGVAIVFSVLSFALLGDAIRDWLDPHKVRRSGSLGGKGIAKAVPLPEETRQAAPRQKAHRPTEALHDSSPN